MLRLSVSQSLYECFPIQSNLIVSSQTVPVGEQTTTDLALTSSYARRRQVGRETPPPEGGRDFKPIPPFI